MNPPVAERRGWELEESFQRHSLDDPGVVFESEKESTFWLWGLILLGVVLAIATYLLGIWLQPPPVVFRAPVPPFTESVPAAYYCSGNTTCSMTTTGTISSCITSGITTGAGTVTSQP